MILSGIKNLYFALSLNLSQVFCNYSDQKQDVSRKAAKLAKNNKKIIKVIQFFLCVFAPLRETLLILVYWPEALPR